MLPTEIESIVSANELAQKKESRVIVSIKSWKLLLDVVFGFICFVFHVVCVCLVNLERSCSVYPSQEILDLRANLDGLERERDYYFR